MPDIAAFPDAITKPHPWTSSRTIHGPVTIWGFACSTIEELPETRDVYTVEVRDSAGIVLRQIMMNELGRAGGVATRGHEIVVAAGDHITIVSDCPQGLMTRTHLEAVKQTPDISHSRDLQFAKFQADAPACNECGAITVRNGNCYLCHNCGNSLGCS